MEATESGGEAVRWQRPGMPYCSVWNAHGIHELTAAEMWLDSVQPSLERAWSEAQSRARDEMELLHIERGMQVVRTLPAHRLRASRGAIEPFWYRNTFAINLPDAPVGHAVLVESDGRLTLETRAAPLAAHSPPRVQ